MLRTEEESFLENMESPRLLYKIYSQRRGSMLLLQGRIVPKFFQREGNRGNELHSRPLLSRIDGLNGHRRQAALATLSQCKHWLSLVGKADLYAAPTASLTESAV